PFKYNTVLSMLDNPRYAGYNTYKGAVIGKGQQTPIVDQQTWDASRARKAATAKYGVRDGSNARKHLLVGFLYCSECFSPMRSHQVKGRAMSYRCTKSNGGCGKVGMKMQWVDDAVSSAVVGKY